MQYRRYDTSSPLPDLLKVKDLEESLKVSKSKIYQLVEAGKLKSVRVGHGIRFLEEDVMAFVRENRT